MKTYRINKPWYLCPVVKSPYEDETQNQIMLDEKMLLVADLVVVDDLIGNLEIFKINDNEIKSGLVVEVLRELLIEVTPIYVPYGYLKAKISR